MNRIDALGDSFIKYIGTDDLEYAHGVVTDLKEQIACLVLDATYNTTIVEDATAIMARKLGIGT